MERVYCNGKIFRRCRTNLRIKFVDLTVIRRNITVTLRSHCFLAECNYSLIETKGIHLSIKIGSFVRGERVDGRF